MDPATEHIPVLCDEVLSGLNVRPGGRYIDATVGAGGHATAILRASSPDGQLLGLDADAEAICSAQQVLKPFGSRAILKTANFRYLGDYAIAFSFGQVDGILMDLGLSSRQLADGQRGFSFAQQGPLDMRFDPTTGQSAADLVNHLPEGELAEVIWRYGEERHSRRIARAIVAARPIITTGQLADLVMHLVGHREKIHPATRTFQALRIAVNDELTALALALPQARDLLRPSGRMAILSFHSLEDRIVKRFFQGESRDCICPPGIPLCTCQHQATVCTITRKPLRPSDEEIARNPRSRSARLRIAERNDLLHGQARKYATEQHGT